MLSVWPHSKVAVRWAGYRVNSGLFAGYRWCIWEAVNPASVCVHKWEHGRSLNASWLCSIHVAGEFSCLEGYIIICFHFKLCRSVLAYVRVCMLPFVTSGLPLETTWSYHKGPLTLLPSWQLTVLCPVHDFIFFSTSCLSSTVVKIYIKWPLSWSVWLGTLSIHWHPPWRGRNSSIALFTKQQPAGCTLWK